MKISRLRTTGEKRAAAGSLAASDPWLALGLDLAQCSRTLSGPFRETYAVKVGGTIAGLVTIAMYGALRGYIQALFVAPGFRGRGLGETLLRFAERKIFAVSPNVFLCVSSFNKGAARFYRRLGYRRAGLLKDFFKKGSDEILMRKTTGSLRGFGTRRKKYVKG